MNVSIDKENIDPNIGIQHDELKSLIFDFQKIAIDYCMDENTELAESGFVMDTLSLEKRLREKEVKVGRTCKHNMYVIDKETDGFVRLDDAPDTGSAAADISRVDAIGMHCIVIPLPNEKQTDHLLPPGPRHCCLTMDKFGKYAKLMRQVDEKKKLANLLYNSNDDQISIDAQYNTYALFLPLKEVKMSLVLLDQHPFKKFILRYAKIWDNGEPRIREDDHLFKVWGGTGSSKLTRCQCRVSLSKYNILFPRELYPGFHCFAIVEGWFCSTNARKAAKKRYTDSEFLLDEKEAAMKRVHNKLTDFVPRHIFEHMQYAFPDVNFIRTRGTKVLTDSEYLNTCIQFTLDCCVNMSFDMFEKEFSSILSMTKGQEIVSWYKNNTKRILDYWVVKVVVPDTSDVDEYLKIITVSTP